MKPSSTVVAVLVLVAVPTLAWMLGPGSTWVLENVDGVTLNNDNPPPATLPPNELTAKDWTAAIATVRGNVLAVATGLAALLAVYYTARNADTARRTFQLGERGHDTDRFSKAVEQLGSGQAPVRLGGLYALEQLAQTNPGLRQTVVDVICAYLRMPYTPPADETSPSPTVEPANAGPNPGVPPPATGRDPHEERQVRLTAQRILAAHLRYQGPPARRWRGFRSVGKDLRYWADIRLDLTGAALTDFDLSNCRVDRAVFSRATFTGLSMFGEATFTGLSMFDKATFTGVVWFSGATFSDDAWFDGATFTGTAWFGEVTGLEEAALDGVRLLPIGPDATRRWPAAWEVVPDGSGGLTLRLAAPSGPHPGVDVGSGAARAVDEGEPETDQASADPT